eukprot:7569617-Pyramimonas_sp.AAC.1
MRNTDADIKFRQEHRLTSTLFTKTKTRLQRAKWRIHGCLRIRAEAGNESGGTMIVSENHLGAWNPPGPDATIYAGRAAGCYLRSGGFGPIALYSVYPKDSTGMKGVNLSVMNNHGLPYIIAGDFNVSPSEFCMGSPCRRLG